MTPIIIKRDDRLKEKIDKIVDKWHKKYYDNKLSKFNIDRLKEMLKS